MIRLVISEGRDIKGNSFTLDMSLWQTRIWPQFGFKIFHDFPLEINIENIDNNILHIKTFRRQA